MFPRLRQGLGTGVLARLDLLIEFSTLGEYGLSEAGRPLAITNLAEHPTVPPARLKPRTRDICSTVCLATPPVSAAVRRRGAPPARS